MSELRYTVEYDHRLGLYRWQIAPGQQLLPRPVATARRFPRLVVLGGGTGLTILLQGLKAALFAPGSAWLPGGGGERLTAIVGVKDNRDGSGCLDPADHRPPPQVRDCLLALFRGEAMMAAIFDFPLNGTGEGQGDFDSGVFGALGRSGDDTTPRLSLEPDGAKALDAIEAADLIIIGPARLYASLIGVLLVKEIAQAIGRSRARVVLVMNLMTELGQTDGYTATDHVLGIRRHVPEIPIHNVLFNTAPIPSELMERYAVDGRTAVRVDVESLRAQGHRPVGRDLLGGGPGVRHDPGKLARAVLERAADLGGSRVVASSQGRSGFWPRGSM